MPRKNLPPPMHVSPYMLHNHIRKVLNNSAIYGDMYLPMEITERPDGLYLVEITRSRRRVDPVHLIAYLTGKYYEEIEAQSIFGSRENPSEHRVGDRDLYFVRFYLKKQTVETYITFSVFPMPPLEKALLLREEARKEKAAQKKWQAKDEWGK